MDPVALTYYALICGLLGAAAPRLGALPVRFVLGAIVGLASAAALPIVRQMLGAA